ncbi:MULTISPECIES: glycosyltransferase family 8 protein [unclassified Synechococcus]|uniref:glycosyltransferase family 8 protein n=1 Tax=unclassified Synechococcus TaxID=2626047 RepID=UPI000B9889B1|nr:MULTISPECIES: glycosyltransferase family 8 protein [unclassified Synechococcus]MBD2717405.1 glycosyltransferase family 8 protein [Synechococcus sp. FACHB-909]
MVNIVIVATANYLWGAAVTVRSALEACSTTLNVYVISVDLSPEDKQKLFASWQTANLGTIKFIDFDLGQVDNLRSTLLVKSKSPYARFFIPEYLADVSRCIYLDTDLIVCSDLNGLQLLDLQGKSSACVIDGGIDTPQQQQRLREKLKLDNPQQYFNSGVIVMDLDAWRERHIQLKALTIAQDNYDLLDQMDQDALNIVLADDWLVLDPKWNTSKGKADIGFSDGIIHFLGKVKPWHADYSANFQDRWFALLDRTAFSGQRPVKLMGIGAAYRKFVRSVPTLEMVKGKLRRLLRSQ